MFLWFYVFAYFVAYVSARVPLIDALPSGAFSGSSQYPDTRCYYYNGRRSSPEAWCAAGNNAGQYLEVDLGEEYEIGSVSVWPRNGAGWPDQFVKTYTLKYSSDGSTFTAYPDTLNGPQQTNTGVDADDEVNSVLDPAISARYLRFYPVTYSEHMSMRIEAYEAGTCTTVADCDSHLACVNGVCQRDCTSFIIDDFLNECSTDYPMAVSDIATNAGDIVTNAGDISQNSADISKNAAEIEAAESRLTADIGEVETRLSQAISNNTGLIHGVDTRLSAAIAANEENITDNGNDISINAGQTSNNAAEIDTNAGDIATNVQSITDNGQNIATSVQSIADNGASIENNANAITGNAGEISANAVNISSNANDISTNANAINSAVRRITTNEGNIGTNVDDIATNVNGISSNANGITANTNAINAAVTRVSANEENILTNGNDIATNGADIAANVAVDNIQTGQIQNNAQNISANNDDIAVNAGEIAILYSKFEKFEAQSQLGHAMSEVQSNVTDSVGYSVKDICIVVLVVLNVLSLIAFCVHYGLSSGKSRKYAEVAMYSSGADDVRCQ